ncbi:universal stress protein [Actinosynnema sp. NPDC023794]
MRGERSSDAGPVVVGIDGSQISEAALAFAFEAADTREVPLIAVRARTDSVIEAAMVPLVDWDAVEAEERSLLAERLAGWGEKYPDVVMRPVVVRDRPAHALIEQAIGTAAQLVVVGSRGRGGAAGLVLGSASHAVLHHSPCPVAVVRPDPSPLGL